MVFISAHDWQVATHPRTTRRHTLGAACRPRPAVAFQKCEVGVGSTECGWPAVAARTGSSSASLYHLAGGGIKIGETQSPRFSGRVRFERNQVDNCLIHDTGHMFHAGVGSDRAAATTRIPTTRSAISTTPACLSDGRGAMLQLGPPQPDRVNHIHHAGPKIATWGQSR